MFKDTYLRSSWSLRFKDAYLWSSWYPRFKDAYLQSSWFPRFKDAYLRSSWSPRFKDAYLRSSWSPSVLRIRRSTSTTNPGSLSPLCRRSKKSWHLEDYISTNLFSYTSEEEIRLLAISQSPNGQYLVGMNQIILRGVSVWSRSCLFAGFHH